MTTPTPVFDIEIIVLEELLNHDVVCTSQTEHDCTVLATHSVTAACSQSGRKFTLWCQGRYDLHMSEHEYLRCAWCQHDADDCWTVLPI